MKILSFNHPVVTYLYECICSAEHKGRYSEECGKQQFWGTIDIHIFSPYYGSQWCLKTSWLQTFFKISSFVFGRTKTFIQVWNYLRVINADIKLWQDFHFLVNYPFNHTSLYLNINWIGARLILKVTQTNIRCFYPKCLTVHSGYTSFFCQYVCSLGIEPTTLCVANAML